MERVRWFGQRGTTTILFALLAPGLIGLVGLSTEAGLWYLLRDRAQNVADAAAMAGAIRLSVAQNQQSLGTAAAQNQASTIANSVTTLNGYTTGATTTVTVNVPPASGSYAGDSAAVQVIVTRTLPRLISGLFLSSNISITTTSTSKYSGGITSPCILVLQRWTAVTSNSTLNASKCTIASNATSGGSASTSCSMSSSSSDSIIVDSCSKIYGKIITMVGTCSGCSGNPFGPTLTSQPATTDSFAYLKALTYPGSCPGGTPTPATSGNIPNPSGTIYWCSDVLFNGPTTLANGTYILYDSNLTLTAGSVTCGACTIVFTGSSPGSIGSITTSSGAQMDITSPTSGIYAAIAMYRDAKATSGTLAWAASVNTFRGVIYAPTSKYTLSAGSTTQVLGCYPVVVSEMTITGYAAQMTNCSSNIVAGGSAVASRVVE